MTASQSVSIHGGLFTAELAIFTFHKPEQPLFVTFYYLEVTITSLNASETLTFVNPFFSVAADYLASGCYRYGSRTTSSNRTWKSIVVFLQ